MSNVLIPITERIEATEDYIGIQDSPRVTIVYGTGLTTKEIYGSNSTSLYHIAKSSPIPILTSTVVSYLTYLGLDSITIISKDFFTFVVNVTEVSSNLTKADYLYNKFNALTVETRMSDKTVDPVEVVDYGDVADYVSFKTLVNSSTVEVPMDMTNKKNKLGREVTFNLRAVAASGSSDDLTSDAVVYFMEPIDKILIDRIIKGKYHIELVLKYRENNIDQLTKIDLTTAANEVIPLISNGYHMTFGNEFERTKYIFAYVPELESDNCYMQIINDNLIMQIGVDGVSIYSDQTTTLEYYISSCKIIGL